MSAVTLFGYTIVKSRAEKDINKLFDQYTKTLNEQKMKMSDDITAWGDIIIRNIEQYVHRQKQLLDQEYVREVNYLNTVWDQCLGEFNIHEKKNNTEKIDQLLNQCNALKFELNALVYDEQSIPVAQVIKGGEPLKINRNHFNTIETENNKPIIEHNNVPEDNNNTYLKPYPNDEQLQGKLSTTSSTSDYSRSASTDDDQKFHDIQDDDLLEKCPICFMIFSPTMIAQDRTQHIHEHYTDE